MGDVLRVVDVVLALALAAVAGVALVLDAGWARKVQHGAFIALGVLLTAGHLATLGQDWNYRLPVLILVVALILVATSAIVHRCLAERRATLLRHSPAPPHLAPPLAAEPHPTEPHPADRAPAPGAEPGER
jgi:hypothetical protein